MIIPVQPAVPHGPKAENFPEEIVSWEGNNKTGTLQSSFCCHGLNNVLGGSVMHLLYARFQHNFFPEVHSALCVSRAGCLDLSADVFKTQEVFFSLPLSLSFCHLSKEEAGTPEVKIAWTHF